MTNTHPTTDLSFGKLMLLATPIALSQLAQIATGVVDIIMAGRLGALGLGAVSTGAAVWTPMMIFLLGLLYGLTHAVGTLRGQGEQEAIPGTVMHGLLIGMLGGTLLGGVLYVAAMPLFSAMSIAPELIPPASAYCRIVAFAFPGLGIFLALRFTLEAAGGAGVVTVAILGSILLKAAANTVLVFGGFGIAPMGVEGFGWSTVIVFWAMAAALVLMTVPVKRFKTLLPTTRHLSALSLTAMAAFTLKSIPIALNFLSDYLVMAVVALCIASIGPVAISSHQITFNIISVALMLTTGFGMAGTVMVSNAMGAGNNPGTRQAVRLGIRSSLALAVALSGLLFLFREQLAALYTTDESILLLAGQIMKVAAPLVIIDVAAITFGFMLRGMGRPDIPFGVMLLAHWAASIPLGYTLARTSLITSPMGTLGWWYGLMAGLFLASGLLAVFLMRELKIATRTRRSRVTTP